MLYILPTETTAALSYYAVRGLYFLAVVFAATIVHTAQYAPNICQYLLLKHHTQTTP